MQNFLKHIEKIMPLCLALFFVRTVFIGYKYLLFAILVLCFGYSACMLFKHGFVRTKIKMLLLPVLVVLLFVLHFSPLSNVVKEIVNIAMVVYFIFFSKLYYAVGNCNAFLKWIMRLTFCAGCLAVIRMFLTLIGISLPLSGYLFEGERFSLVYDGNFYSLFFIISIILSAKLFANALINRIECQLVNIVSAINIVASLSRRAYLLYALVVVGMAIAVVFKWNNFKKSLQYNLLTISAIGVSVVIAMTCTHIFYTPNMSNDPKNRYYKMCSLFDNDMSYKEFHFKQLRKYYAQFVITDSANLFYNGDLQNGLSAWEAFSAPNDCIRFEMVGSEDGDSVIRVERECATGYWQVHYKGRPIVYHKDVTYEISFAFRVLKGSELPFFVGWGVTEGKIKLHKLPMVVEPIDSIWKRCMVIYKFREDYLNPHCFLNCLQAGSTIEVKDIRLTCDDTTGLPRYVDQLPDSVIHRYYSNDTINYFTASRTDRWRYALELWQTRYNTKQWYGEKFFNNPKRYDFPHNPIISSFLYSGIIGGVVYIIFLIMSLWLYWKKRQQLGIFFIMYLCCMFFSMFSGSSHFSFPLFAFLSFLPFVEYKSEEKAEKVNVTQG